jgi:hypothetical protein
MTDRLPEPVRSSGALRPVRVAISPAAVVGAGAGVVTSALVGLPVVAVVVVAGAGWLVGSAATAIARVLRRRSPPTPAEPRPNPYALPQPWRDLVADVLRAQQRFAETAHTADAGPLQDHLLSLQARLDDGVRECWLVARRGADLEAAVARLDPGEIRRRIILVQGQIRTADPSSPGTPRLHETADALRSQQASVERIQAVANDAQSRLQLLGAHLGEAVAKAVELSVGQADDLDLERLTDSVESAVSELETLRRAMAETTGA